MLSNCIIKKRKHMKKLVRCEQNGITCSGIYRFTKDEIKNAVDFTDGRKSLGRGRNWEVFMGMLPSGQLVTIKEIYAWNTLNCFAHVIEDVSKVRHPNLVSLLGCFFEDGTQYLVYDYFSTGNLAQYLLRKDTVLTWAKRVKILRDCACALRTLHTHEDGCLTHEDIKLSNILLTADLEPKLSGFGLAKLTEWKGDEVVIRGDPSITGYVDPEYMVNGKFTSASDIYSYGIVILQVLSGRKVIEFDIEAREQLTRKANDVIRGNRPLTIFQDQRLGGNVNDIDFKSILQIAVKCVASLSSKRPTIHLICNELEKAWENAKAEMIATCS